MIGTILCNAMRAATPSLSTVFFREAVRAGAAAAGAMAVYGAARVIRDQYDRHQREMLPQVQNQNGRWN